jgi:tetratricopeptide (TPR) repeat protein
MRYNLFILLLLSGFCLALFGQKSNAPPPTTLAVDIPAAVTQTPQVEGLAICQLSWQNDLKFPEWKLIYASQPGLKAMLDQVVPELVEKQQIKPQHSPQLLPVIFQNETRSNRPAEAWMKEGELCQSYGLMQTAVMLLEKAESLQKPRSESFYAGLEARKRAHIQLENWSAVQRDLQSQLSLASKRNSDYASQQGLLRLQSATVALLNKNQRKALTEFFWLQQHPETRVPLNWLNAWVLSSDDARLLAYEATKLEASLPGTTPYWLRNIRAQALAMAGHHQHAYQLFDTLLNATFTAEQRSSALSQKGWAYFREGNLKEARNSLERARNILPGQALSEFYLGMTLVQLKSEDEAIRAFNQALQLGLPNDEADHARQLNQVLGLNSQYASLRPD